MFNPQRKSKVNDIYMQQKWYQMHINKIKDISNSNSPAKQRQKQQLTQQRYLKRLSMSKKQVNTRINSQIKNFNHKLFLKLLDTDNRKEQNPEMMYFKNKKKHFNSYYTSKKQMSRVSLQNLTMVTRMMNSLSQVPTLKQCKKQFKKNKKLAEICRKLPSIIEHEQQYKKKFSKRYFDQSSVKSRLKTSRISHLKFLNDSFNSVQKKQRELLGIKQFDSIEKLKEKDKIIYSK